MVHPCPSIASETIIPGAWHSAGIIVFGFALCPSKYHVVCVVLSDNCHGILVYPLYYCGGITFHTPLDNFPPRYNPLERPTGALFIYHHVCE